MSKKFSVNGTFKDSVNTIKFLTERKQFIDSAPAVLPTRTDDFGVNKVAKSLHPKEQKLVISRIEEHADIAKSYYFKSETELAYFKAGQYLTFKLEIGNSVVTRSYSIASSPASALNGEYQITVKRIADGFVSDYILDNWSVGDKVIAYAPEGNLVYNPLRDAENIVGIAGGSGSGKSTFAKRLKEAFPDQISLVSCDNYYIPHDDIALEERAKLNYDAPEALEFDLMVRHLEELKNGQAALCPVYDFTQHTRSSSVIKIEPRPIILIDGILIFHDEALRECMDLKIYVETDADERILRRARRDMAERGRDLDGIIEQYLATVKPMHNQYVEPTKAYADIIINGGLNDRAYDLVKNKIQSILRKRG